ncbi:MAG: hypothetical protein KJ956_09170, partial [Actinobacteria bacterium]|nr:hypothetical protein [Actinomycetota bacterium]
MVDHPLEPEELTAAGLPTARRGYDRKAVIALLDEASRRWRELRDHHDAVIAEIDRRGGVENLGRDLREIGERAATILGEAQAAADDLRTHAVEEAQARIDGALEHAGEVEGEADRTAFRLRKDAWEAGTELLAQVRSTIAAMIERAEADTLIIRAKAEQDGHRHLADARKEAADITRNARFEAERLMGEAKRRADQLLADAAQAGIAASAVEVDRRVEWGVTVIDREAARRGGDPAAEIDPHHPAYGDVLAAEVSSLREQAPEPPEPPPDAPKKVATHAPEDRPRLVASEPEPEILDESAPSESQAAAEEAAPAPEADVPGPEEAPPAPAAEPEAPGAPPDDAGGGDDVGGLFERLRRTDEIPVVPPIAAAAKRRPASKPKPKPEPGPARRPPPAAGPDAIEIRERRLLPLLNEYVRIARAELMETQNVALDEIRRMRRGVTWVADPELIGDPLRNAVAPLAAAAVEAGGRAAGDMGAGPAPESASVERAVGLIEGMVGALVAAATGAAAAADQGAEVARMFRSWRNDEVERWVRTAGYAGYHDGLAAGLAGAGFGEIVGVRHGRLCGQCPASAGVV